MHDAVIVGAGPVGLAMARALTLEGCSVTLCGVLPRHSHNSPDMRTAALFSGSIRFLRRLGAWEAVRRDAAPLNGIRIVDDTGNLLRAPEQTFTAPDPRDAQLGYNVPNPSLTAALAGILEREARAPLTLDIGRTVTEIAIGSDGVTVTLDDGSKRRARVAIGADGRGSLARRTAGIESKAWDRDQAAVTAHFTHALDHQGMSTEIHRKAGPCTVVPVAPNRSSLVWMDTTDAAARRAALDDPAFIAELESALHGLLGPISEVTPRRVFPLTTLLADRFAANRTALVGEAGHAFPPIGAQGLNLGLRDVASLADHIGDAVRAGRDPGSDTVLQAYDKARRADILARTYGVDAFNRSLSGRASGLVRGAILHATSASPTIRRFLVERGIEPVGAWPTMMQP